jgi:hypothetical protein
MCAAVEELQALLPAEHPNLWETVPRSHDLTIARGTITVTSPDVTLPTQPAAFRGGVRCFRTTRACHLVSDLHGGTYVIGLPRAVLPSNGFHGGIVARGLDRRRAGNGVAVVLPSSQEGRAGGIAR